jgi:hypothetical protein
VTSSFCVINDTTSYYAWSVVLLGKIPKDVLISEVIWVVIMKKIDVLTYWPLFSFIMSDDGEIVEVALNYRGEDVPVTLPYQNALNLLNGNGIKKYVC